MGVHSIDYYAYASRLRGVNAGYKMFLSLSALLCCVVAGRMGVSVFTAVTMGAVTVGLGGLPLRRYLMFLTVPAAFMALGSIAIAVDFGSRPAGDWNLNLHFFYLFVTEENLFRMTLVLGKAFGAVSAMFMLVLSTPSGEIIAVLRKLHVPKLMIELMNMMYRFIFIILDVYGKMHHSAESRLGFTDYRTSLRTIGSMAGNLLVLSLKRANTYYDALESRGYDGELLFLEEEKRCSTAQILAAALYLAALLLIWRFLR